MTKHLLYEERRGSLRDHEDWWYVLVDDEAAVISVIHEWSRGSLGLGTSGEKTYAVDEFLASDGPDDVKTELEEFIAGDGHA